jgi:hypothetical protein
LKGAFAKQMSGDNCFHPLILCNDIIDEAGERVSQFSNGLRHGGEVELKLLDGGVIDKKSQRNALWRYCGRVRTCNIERNNERDIPEHGLSRREGRPITNPQFDSRMRIEQKRREDARDGARVTNGRGDTGRECCAFRETARHGNRVVHGHGSIAIDVGGMDRLGAVETTKTDRVLNYLVGIGQRDDAVAIHVTNTYAAHDPGGFVNGQDHSI